MILFLAWQDAGSRQWFPIGRLTRAEDGRFEFVYTQGYRIAEEATGMMPLPAFPDVERVYRSETLFPMFNNRIMSPSREEYPNYLARMNLTGQAAPLSILARSLGRRTTDSFEVFPFPIDEETGEFEIDFFVHGIRHRPQSAQDRTLTFQPGDRLGVAHDTDNTEDPCAMYVTAPGGEPIGFVPRYYAPDLLALVREGAPIEVTVEQVNPPVAPIQQRLLVRLRAPWVLEDPPFERDEYRPIPGAARLAG